jgi:hypothetical protein
VERGYGEADSCTYNEHCRSFFGTSRDSGETTAVYAIATQVNAYSDISNKACSCHVDPFPAVSAVLSLETEHVRPRICVFHSGDSNSAGIE